MKRNNTPRTDPEEIDRRLREIAREDPDAQIGSRRRGQDQETASDVEVVADD